MTDDAQYLSAYIVRCTRCSELLFTEAVEPGAIAKHAAEHRAQDEVK